MEKLNIILNDGVEKEVDCIFYLYNSKYYFIYTEKEIDENGYVVLYLSQVGKEIKNTPNGPIETGYMVGVEITDYEEWKNVQSSVAKIVEDAKNGTKSGDIQYLPLNMLSKLKIVSKKTFRLMKDIVVDSLHVDISNTLTTENPVPITLAQESAVPEANTINESTAIPLSDMVEQNVVANTQPIETLEQPSIFADNTPIQEPISNDSIEDNNVIIDYRAKFFEEQEKNNQLQQQIDELNNKIEQIKNILN